MRKRASKHNRLGIIIGWLMVLAFMPFAFLEAQTGNIPSSKYLNKYVIEVWQALDGLPSNSVLAITQRADGSLWISTDNGIVKFDGIKFLRALPTIAQHDFGKASCFLNHSSGNLFFGSQNNGLFWYNNNEYKLYNTESGLNSNNVLSLAELKDGSVAVGTDNGLCFLVGDSVVPFLDSELLLGRRIEAMAVNLTSDTLYVSIAGIGIGSVVDNKFKLIESNSDVVTEVLSMLLDHNNRLWIGTGSGLYIIENGTIRHIELQGFEADVEETPIKSIIETRNHEIWVGSRKGIYVLSGKGDFISFKGTEHGISHNDIRSLYQDIENNIWVGTYRGGLNRVSIADAKSITMAYGLGSNNIYGLYCNPTNGDLWAGGYGALTHYDNGSIKVFRTNANMPLSRIRAIVDKNSDLLYLGTYGDGLLIFDVTTGKVTQTFTTNNSKLNSNIIRALCKDEKGNLWVGTRKGLTVFKPNGSQTSYKLPEVNAIEVVGDALFILTDGGGLFRFKNNSIELFPAFQQFNSEVLLSFAKFSNSIFLVGTNNGLGVVFNNVAYSYRNDNPIFRHSINQIIDDSLGNIWFGTSNGIYRVLRNELEAFVKNNGRIRLNYVHYQKENGITSVQTSVPAKAVRNPINSRLFFPTPDGITLIDPDQFIQASVTPNCEIVAIRINGVELDFAGLSSVVIPAGSRIIEIEYTAYSYRNPEALEFSYWLTDIDPQPRFVGNRRIATYTNLKPGDYQFNLMVNNNGSWSNKPLILNIKQEALFTQTIYFYALLIIPSLGLLFLIYLARVRVFKRREEKLERMVIARTKEIDLQNELLRNQKTEIDRLFLELTDSVRTAKRIQDAILPSPKVMAKALPPHFVLYKPRDIVSGDFYWVLQSKHCTYFAVADCTGHGVAGAFMSLIGVTLLSQITASNPQISPSHCLSMLHKGVLDALRQEDLENAISSGMDISLIRIDHKTNEVDFAGASASVLFVRNGKLMQIKGDRNPIGLHRVMLKKVIDSGMIKQREFDNHRIKIQPNDTLYLYTDGYADQFGGESGEEKMMLQRFRNFILEGSNLQIEEQSSFFLQKIDDWRKNTPQIDDILVAGIRFDKPDK